MNPWRPFPLLRLVFPFLSGIVLAIIIDTRVIALCWISGSLLLLFFFGANLPRAWRNFRYRSITGILINLFLLVTGFEFTSFYHFPENDDSICTVGTYIVEIIEPPSIKRTSVKSMVKIVRRWDQIRWFKVNTKALIYVKPHSMEPPLQYGDHLLIHTSFQRIINKSNPHSFNYAGFLKIKGFTHQSWLSSNQWKKLSIFPSGFFRRMAFSLRDRLLNILRKNQVSGKEFAVSAALLLGYVEELDADLRHDYSATGAMHILSVSGMHVGIIYLFLEFVLGFLNRNKITRFFKAVIILAFIWFYALLTGLSPCVLRSAAMLSLPILGKAINRNVNMFNILSASFFLLLLIDPFLVLDIGFQLSYLAVIGIVLLYKPVYDLFITSWWLPDKIWSIVAVSIAAQIATLPLTLYTFHQFPNYFMITNIFVVPLSSLVIYSGIFALFVGNIPLLSLIAAKVLCFLVWLLNTIIHFIEELPVSTLQGINLTFFEMILLYLFMITFCLWLANKKFSLICAFLITLFLLNTSFLYHKISRLQSARFLVFNARNLSLFEFNYQNRAVILYDFTEPLKDDLSSSIRQALESDLVSHRIDNSRFYWARIKESWQHPFQPSPDFCKSGHFVQFHTKRIGFLNKKIPNGINMKMNLDILVLSGNIRDSLINIRKVFCFKEIVIDPTNSEFRSKAWIREAEKSPFRCHAVKIEGAFEREF
ncbi:MAG: ComEC family competence protein [Bacteroidales bacterium]|nr:ComEC family competence protein [Bacteroidales bacterium]